MVYDEISIDDHNNLSRLLIKIDIHDKRLVITVDLYDMRP